MENDHISKMLKLTRSLFYINAAVWLAFGTLGFIQSIPGRSALRLILSVLMFSNAFVMILFGMIIMRRRAWILFLGILYTALNVVLSFTDQFGWIDAIILLLNLCLLGLLFITRQRMNQAAASASEEI